MPNLDETLRSILEEYYQQRTLDLIKQKTSFAKVGEQSKPAKWHTDAIAQIHQAYKDAGYVNIEQLSGDFTILSAKRASK